ncbi:MAG: 1-deoxy-D-xylulose-5-phosphate synthase [Myxococcaceae bacterium]|nr:1-deoxy-D-xylulose-5-phosphate synthase [Myxococcaceae bacterium]
MSSILSRIQEPADVRALSEADLAPLCAELREEIIRVCGKVGGHLGASLGAVELIVALHRVFKSPVDRIVFDVGHQAYAHKLLTGRLSAIDTLRQEGGIAPFPDPAESRHDAFQTGHACTAVSVALGMLEAKRLRREDGHAVAVIGDGSLTGGLTFEGLNNAATARAPLVVVLNDNGMSISVNVGAVSRMLRGPEARAFFESLGFTYLGPIDGHDLRALIDAFREARRARRPIVVHVRTEKGKGFAEAEGDPHTRGHAMGPYEWRDGKLVRSRGGQQTFSEAFAAALGEAMARDERVVAVTPAMLEGSALVGLARHFPERVFDVGIAEQHAVTFSAGLAAQGMRPVCAIYSTFLQRAVDQVIHDVCLAKLPVIFAVDRAGLVGADGATHQGAFDVALLRPIPHLTLAAPVFGEDCGPLLDAALRTETGAWAIRFPRLTIPRVPPGIQIDPAPRGARWLRRVERPIATVITLGTMGLAALEAVEGRDDVAVLDARFVTPLDAEAIREAARTGAVLTVEEGTTHGGLGSAVLELLCAERLSPRVRMLGLPDTFVRHGDARAQRARLGLDAAGIRAALEQLAS